MVVVVVVPWWWCRVRLGGRVLWAGTSGRAGLAGQAINQSARPASLSVPSGLRRRRDETRPPVPTELDNLELETAAAAAAAAWKQGARCPLRVGGALEPPDADAQMDGWMPGGWGATGAEQPARCSSTRAMESMS